MRTDVIHSSMMAKPESTIGLVAELCPSPARVSDFPGSEKDQRRCYARDHTILVVR